jgi:hypothetical protein
VIPSHWRLPIVALYAAAVASFAIAIAQFYRPNTGFTYLIEFGETFHEQKLPAVRDAVHYTHVGSPGYDGQFYAQLAVDPLLRDRRIDTALDWPAYRARRILFAWTAWAMGLGRPGPALKAYALQNILAWLLIAVLLMRWLPPTGPRQLTAWFGCLFGSGLIGSVRLALLEGPSLLLLVLAILAMERGLRWPAAALVGISGLGRETNLLSAGLVVDRRSWTGGVPAHAGLALVVALPLALWMLYLRTIYPDPGALGEYNYSLPLVEYFAKWGQVLAALAAEGPRSFARFSLFALVSLTTQAGFLLLHRQWDNAWWRAGMGYVLLLVVLGPAVWDGIPGAAIRVLLPLSVAFNVLVVSHRWFWPLVILGNLSVLHGLQLLLR